MQMTKSTVITNSTSNLHNKNATGLLSTANNFSNFALNTLAQQTQLSARKKANQNQITGK